MALLEKKVESTEVFNGKIISVQLDKVEIPDGSIRPREVVRHNGAVCVVPIDNDGYVYMVRQFRYAAGREVLEIPAGKLESSENPYDCAVRELSEETGCTARGWTNLGQMLPSPGYCDEVIHVYMATDLVEGEIHLDDGEFLNVEKYKVEQILEMIMSNKICDAKTVFAILKACRILGI